MIWDSLAETNGLAIVVAGIAGWMAGALWYGLLFSKQWMAAQDITEADIQAAGSPAAPFIISFVLEMVMAVGLATLVPLLGEGEVNVGTGLVAGLALFVGFVATTITINYSYSRRKPMLLLLDGAHWLLVLLVMGLVIGIFG